MRIWDGREENSPSSMEGTGIKSMRDCSNDSLRKATLRPPGHSIFKFFMLFIVFSRDLDRQVADRQPDHGGARLFNCCCYPFSRPTYSY